MNKVYMSFSSTCDLVRRGVVRLSDIRRAEYLVFNAAREYWDTDSFVPEEFLTLDEKVDLLKRCRSNGVNRFDVMSKKNQINKSHLPEECVVHWNLLHKAILEVDRDRMVISKEEFYDEGFIPIPFHPKPEGYIGWASTLSKRGTFVFMGDKLWIPREGDFCSTRGTIAHSSSTFLQLIHEGLSEKRLQHDLLFQKYSPFEGCLGEGITDDNFWTVKSSREQSAEVGHA